MNLTHTAKMTIQADADTIWEAITRNDFVKDFLPEVRKNIQTMGDYAQATHRNAKDVLPAYAVTGQAIGWEYGNRHYHRIASQRHSSEYRSDRHSA